MSTCCSSTGIEWLAVHAYQEQESQQTLAQALQEYHAVHPGLSQARHMNPKAAFFFRCHDTVHVVFGCGVELDDEAVVKIASILGTTAGLSVLKGYVLQESLDIYWQLRVVDVLRAIGHAVVLFDWKTIATTYPVMPGFSGFLDSLSSGCRAHTTAEGCPW